LNAVSGFAVSQASSFNYLFLRLLLGADVEVINQHPIIGTLVQEISYSIADYCPVFGSHHGCQILLGPNIPNDIKLYQMTANYAKRPYIIPNDQKIFLMIMKYFPFQAPPNFSHIGIFG
jgi:hypothetical protein